MAVHLAHTFSLSTCELLLGCELGSSLKHRLALCEVTISQGILESLASLGGQAGMLISHPVDGQCVEMEEVKLCSSVLTMDPYL